MSLIAIADVALAPLAATAAMASACAVLSIVVVARRWAFIGEGISHSGFGGAGLAWILMLIFPSMLDRPGVSYAAVVVFCFATALAIGYLSRGDRVTGDAAIGIFLVASLAFGFLAQQIFRHVKGTDPAGFHAYLFGQIGAITPATAGAVIAVSVAVLLTLFALQREILAYCFDPLLAETSGVRAGFIHYLLMMLIALVIIIGLPITGSVLVTALLVLPGVTATMLSRRLDVVIAISTITSLIAAGVGVSVNAAWPFIPIGPAIVLVLVGQFMLAYVAARIRLTRSSSTAQM